MQEPGIGATSARRFLDADRFGGTEDDETAEAPRLSVCKLARGMLESASGTVDEVEREGEAKPDFGSAYDSLSAQSLRSQPHSSGRRLRPFIRASMAGWLKGARRLDPIRTSRPSFSARRVVRTQGWA